MRRKGSMDAVNITIVVLFAMILSMMLIMVAREKAYHEYTGQVIAIEKNAWMYKTTTITLKTYSESTVSVFVNGFHDLEIGEIYKIETQGDWYWYAPDMLSMERLS